MNTLGRRIIGAIPVLLGISFLIFLLMHIAPGDPVTLLLGDDATPADIERTRHEWGLDQPLIVQYYEFLNRAVRGDFGKSLKFNESVTKLIAERLPATLELAFASLCVAITIAVQNPERVLALVLVATAARLTVTAEMLDAARRRAEGQPDAPMRPIPLEAVVSSSTPAGRVRRLERMTMTAPPRAVYADLLANQRFDAGGRARAIPVPTLVIGCSDDRLVPVPLAAALAASIPGAELVILPKCGHYPHVERAPAFNFALVKFLGRVSLLTLHAPAART